MELFFLCQKFGGFIPIAYLCDKKNELAAHVRLGNSSVYFNSETQLLSLMAGRTLRGCIAQRITKVAKHSNPVIRSLFISTVRLSFHKERVFRLRNTLFSFYSGFTYAINPFIKSRLLIFLCIFIPLRIKHIKPYIYVAAKTI